jgi:Na+/H+ antiporter NhaD/arsenite permease-like protein
MTLHPLHLLFFLSLTLTLTLGLETEESRIIYGAASVEDPYIIEFVTRTLRRVEFPFTLQGRPVGDTDGNRVVAGNSVGGGGGTPSNATGDELAEELILSDRTLPRSYSLCLTVVDIFDGPNSSVAQGTLDLTGDLRNLTEVDVLENKCFTVRHEPSRNYAEFLLDEDVPEEWMRALVLGVNITDPEEAEYYEEHGGFLPPLSFAGEPHFYGAAGVAQLYLAAVVLIFTYVAIVTEVMHHTLIACTSAFFALLLLAIFGKAPSLERVMEFLDVGTLALLFGMMVIVGGLSETGVFEYAAVRAFEASGGSLRRLAIILCVLCATLSAFLDNVTTVLLLAPVTIRMSQLLDMNPIPFLIGELFMSKIGGIATLIGDPPNILIASALSDYIDFVTFVANMAPAAILISGPSMMHLLYYYRTDVAGSRLLDASDLRREYTIHDPVLFKKTAVIGGLVLLAFFLQPLHGIEPAWAALAGAIGILIATSSHDVSHALEKYVEWDSLIFFAGLFVMVESLAELGLIRFIGDLFISLVLSVEPEARYAFSLVLLLWISAFLSAFIDNIPYAATMIPVIIQMSESPELQLPIKPLAWCLALGADIGGNGTLVASSGNLVVAGIAKQFGHPISFGAFFRVGMPNMIISTAVANVYVLVVYVWLEIGVGLSLYEHYQTA